MTPEVIGEGKQQCVLLGTTTLLIIIFRIQTQTVQSIRWI